MRFIGLLFAILAFINFNFAAPLGSSEVKNSNTNEIRSLLSKTLFKRDGTAAIFEDDESLVKRDVAVITEFFTVLNRSGLVVPVVKILATNKITEPLLVDAIVAFLKTQNLADLLHAVDESSLAVDIVLRVLHDSTFFPGLYNIISGLRTGAIRTPSANTLDTGALTSALLPIMRTYSSSQFSGLSSNLHSTLNNLGIKTSTNSGLLSVLNPVLSKFGLGSGSSDSSSLGSTKVSTSTSIASSAASPTTSAKDSSTPTSKPTTSTSSSSSSSSYLTNLLAKLKSAFHRRDNYDDDMELSKRDNQALDSLLESLEKSGLAMSVINLIATDPSMAPFARDLITQIVKKKAITLSGLRLALDSTNLLNDAIIDTLSSPKLGIIIS